MGSLQGYGNRNFSRPDVRISILDEAIPRGLVIVKAPRGSLPEARFAATRTNERGSGKTAQGGPLYPEASEGLPARQDPAPAGPPPRQGAAPPGHAGLAHATSRRTVHQNRIRAPTARIDAPCGSRRPWNGKEIRGHELQRVGEKGKDLQPDARSDGSSERDQPIRHRR